MKKFVQGLFEGERALYDTHDAEIIDSTFQDGESPLKECSNIIIQHSIFKWKYPTRTRLNSNPIHSTRRTRLFYICTTTYEKYWRCKRFIL